MGLNRELVRRLDPLRAAGECRRHIADVLRQLLLGDRLRAPVIEHLGLLGQAGAGRPARLQRLRRLDRRPFVARNDGDEVALAHRLHEAGDLLRLAVVVGLQPGAEVIGADDPRMQHAGQPHVLHEGELARHLGRDVDACDRLADHLVVLGRFQRRLRIDRKLEIPVADQFGVRHGLAGIELVDDHAVDDHQLGGRDAELLRRALDQRMAGGRRGTAQLAAALRNRQVGAGDPLVRRGRGVAHHHLDALERDVELVGRHLRHRGLGTGAEVDLAGVDGDSAVSPDADERVDRVLGNRLRRRQDGGSGSRRPGRRNGAALQREADDEHGARALEQRAALQQLGGAHGGAPQACAARSTALQMRW